MDADLDTLCIAVYCTADDLLPAARANARRKVSDAELVTLCVAQAIMGVPSDRRFLAVARRQLGHLFPRRPGQAGYHKRRRALAETIAWLIGVVADRSPGAGDRLLLIDSTPVECARSRETVMRSALADAADYGYSASHSRFFWGFRLHAIFAPDGTPRALAFCSPEGRILVGDKGYAGRAFASGVDALGATIVRPTRADEPGRGPHLAPIRQRIESIFFTCTDLLTLERHGARTLAGLRERVAQRFLCLAACVWLNHQLGRPSRSLVAYVA